MSVNRSDDGIAPCPVIASLAAKHGLPFGSLEDQPAEKCIVLMRTPKEKVVPTLECTGSDTPAEQEKDTPAECVLECASTACGSPSVAGSGSPSAACVSPSRSASPAPDAAPSPETPAPLVAADGAFPRGRAEESVWAQSRAHAEQSFQARAEQALIARLRATRAHAARLREERAGGQSARTAVDAAPEAPAKAEQRNAHDIPTWLSLVSVALLLLVLVLNE